MAHNFETGFTVREPAWHGLATVLDDYPGSWKEARRLAGLDWEPVEAPVYVGDPMTAETLFDDGSKPPQLVHGWKAVTRSDTGALLHVHQNSYEVFPNAELGPLVESLLDEGDVRYETAGVLDGGRKVWVLLRLAEPVEVPGDPAGATLNYLALQNSHDGSSALRAQRTAIRIVCQNTSTAADREASRHGMQYVFRHTANIRDRIEAAKAALQGLRDDRQSYLDWATDLLGIPVTAQQRELFVTEFVPDPPTDELISDRVRANIETAREDLRTILASPTTRDTAHTAYGLVQAATEYADWFRKARTQETRFARSVLNPEPLKRQAEQLARQIAYA